MYDVTVFHFFIDPLMTDYLASCSRAFVLFVMILVTTHHDCQIDRLMLLLLLLMMMMMTMNATYIISTLQSDQRTQPMLILAVDSHNMGCADEFAITRYHSCPSYNDCSAVYLFIYL
jgi:hypothetical protein